MAAVSGFVVGGKSRARNAAPPTLLTQGESEFSRSQSTVFRILFLRAPQQINVAHIRAQWLLKRVLGFIAPFKVVRAEEESREGKTVVGGVDLCLIGLCDPPLLQKFCIVSLRHYSKLCSLNLTSVINWCIIEHFLGDGPFYL